MFSGLFLCKERRGNRIRYVREVEPGFALEDYLRERIDPAWSPIKNLELLWSKGVRVFLVDDVGAMFKGPFERNGMPDVHVVFWDRVLVGREQLARSMAKWIALEYQAPGVWTAIPIAAKVAIAFARRIGFETDVETEKVITMKLIT